MTPSPHFNALQFLSEYWQQKPLLITGFFSNFSDPLSPEELAGLALEEGVESRLVRRQAGLDYRLQHGPFQESDFLALPASDWTLLVQAVDQMVPAVAEMKQAFNFLPAWRIDDIMVSHAVPGGGVGPHLDQYDVFLIQGAGSRRWKLGGKCSPQHQQSNQSGLKLLREFDTEQEVTLNCGDVLYIPPGYAHWGTAELSGLCYSIGFRAPSQAELVEVLSDLVIEKCSDFDRYRDPLSPALPKPGEIPLAGLANAWSTVQQVLQRPELLQQGFGELVTQAKYPELVLPAETALELQQLQQAAAQNLPLLRNPASRFAWLDRQAESPEIALFVDGEMHSHPRENLQAIISLCDLTIENLWEISWAENPDAWHSQLLDLHNRGSLWLEQPL